MLTPRSDHAFRALTGTTTMAHSTTTTASHILTKYSKCYVPAHSSTQSSQTDGAGEWQHFVNPVLELVLDIKKSRLNNELESVRLRILWNMDTSGIKNEVLFVCGVFTARRGCLLTRVNTRRRTWISLPTLIFLRRVNPSQVSLSRPSTGMLSLESVTYTRSLQHPTHNLYFVLPLLLLLDFHAFFLSTLGFSSISNHFCLG